MAHTYTQRDMTATTPGGVREEASRAHASRGQRTMTPVGNGLTATTRADALTSAVARGTGAVGLTAIGLIHLLDAPGKLDETPYMFWLYLALIAGCLLGATLLVRAHSRLAWTTAAILGASPFIGYVLDRTTGLPGAMGDIGNWTEPLGMASLFVEACVVALSLYGLALIRRAHTGS
jgi:hypothetical protein